MSAVTKQEIVTMIEGLIESDACMGSISNKQAITALELANRIRQHGIAPPDEWVLVPEVATEQIIEAIIERGNQHGDDISYDTAVLIWNDAIYAAAPEVSNEQ